MPQDVRRTDDPNGWVVNEIANAGLDAVKQACAAAGVEREQYRAMIFIRLDDGLVPEGQPNSTGAGTFPAPDGDGFSVDESGQPDIHGVMLAELMQHVQAIAEAGGIPLVVGELPSAALSVPGGRLL